MNTKQQNILRSLLKKYKYKNANNVIRQALGINFENFLQKTEPLYIIPRIASCYAEEDKRNELMGVVYKEWLKDVVEKRWVAPVNQYSDEHGEHTVLQAIYYLIDTDLWDVYEGRLALDARESNYYDKLVDMPSAIAIVQENEKKEQQEQQDTQKVATTSDNDSSWVFEPDYVSNGDEALTLINSAEEMCMRLSKNVGRVANYILTAVESDILRKKIDDQLKQMEEQKALHQKEMTSLQAKLDAMQAKSDEVNATMLKASDYIAKLKNEAKDAEKQYDVLNAKYKKALDERDDADKELNACKKLLEEEANREQLPKKKVIPYSALDAVPLLGKGVMTGLVPVLSKYNIVVDYNR